MNEIATVLQKHL